jgi:SAM-dependent methyltransferase
MTPNENTYLLGPESPDEMAHLLNMDRFLTSAMSGPLAPLPYIPDQTRILDLACGPGGWALNAAAQYPTCLVTGVDINHAMIDYARANAKESEVSNVSFELADVTKPLPFADKSFDIVNARFLVAVLLRSAWKPFIIECTRILRSSGILLLTEPIDMGVTNSPSFEEMKALSCRVMWQTGYGFSVDGRTLDVTFMLPPRLWSAGHCDIEHAVYALDFSKGTSAWADFYQSTLIGYKRELSHYAKFADLSAEGIEQTYHRMLTEMNQDDFSGMFHFMTVAGMKSESKL